MQHQPTINALPIQEKVPVLQDTVSGAHEQQNPLQDELVSADDDDQSHDYDDTQDSRLYLY